MLYKLFKRESPAHPWIPVDEGTDLAELITQGEILDIYGERGQRWRFLVEDATGKKVAGNPDLVYRVTAEGEVYSWHQTPRSKPMTSTERAKIRTAVMSQPSQKKEITILQAVDLADARAARRKAKRQAKLAAEAARRAAVQITWNDFVIGAQPTGFRD